MTTALNQLTLIGEKRTAVFSDDRVYRYTLEIVWDQSSPLLMVIGLNPSTADEFKDDPTLRRCKGFAKEWGHGGLIMTNLFAFRATEPKAMKAHHRPIGELLVGNAHWSNRNDLELMNTRARVSSCLCAWGNHGDWLNRDEWVYKNLTAAGLIALKLTSAGFPQHPLYVAANTQPIPFP